MNEKNVKEQLRHANLTIVTRKYPSKYRKQRQELVNRGNYQSFTILLKKKLAIKVIMDCRTAIAVEFRSRLGFNQHDPIMTKEQSVLSKIMKMFSTKKFYYIIYYIIITTSCFRL